MTFEEADAKYPFDPKARAEFLTGIAKIACFDDPKMRRSVFEAMSGTVRRQQVYRPRVPKQEGLPYAEPTEERRFKDD